MLVMGTNCSIRWYEVSKACTTLYSYMLHSLLYARMWCCLCAWCVR
jgi:hypothetical protein